MHGLFGVIFDTTGNINCVGFCHWLNIEEHILKIKIKIVSKWDLSSNFHMMLVIASGWFFFNTGNLNHTKVLIVLLKVVSKRSQKMH